MVFREKCSKPEVFNTYIGRTLLIVLKNIMEINLIHHEQNVMLDKIPGSNFGFTESKMSKRPKRFAKTNVFV